MVNSPSVPGAAAVGKPAFAALPHPANYGGNAGEPTMANRRVSAQIIPIGGGGAPTVSTAHNRAQGIGSRFRPRPSALPKEQIS